MTTPSVIIDEGDYEVVGAQNQDYIIDMPVGYLSMFMMVMETIMMMVISTIFK